MYLVKILNADHRPVDVEVSVAIRIKLTSGLPFKPFGVHILTPFPSQEWVIYPFSAAFHGRTTDLPTGMANFFKKVFLKTKCARLQDADRRKGNIKSI